MKQQVTIFVQAVRHILDLTLDLSAVTNPK